MMMSKLKVPVVIYKTELNPNSTSDNNITYINVNKNDLQRYFVEVVANNYNPTISFDEWYNNVYTADDTVGLVGYLGDDFMLIEWNLTEEKYNKYKEHQTDEENRWSYDREYIGKLKIGSLCFDIFDNGNYLDFDLYVGGVYTGYGFKVQEDGTQYPYDYCDVGCFQWHEDIQNISLEQFKKELEEFCVEHIFAIESYVADGQQVINLIKKAKETIDLM